MNFRNILIILAVTFQSYPCLAQNTPQEEALQLFEEGRYAEALPVYKRLVTLFPKDPRYQYYVGVCMVQSNTDIQKSIDYLKYSAEKPVPRDAYFYLGKAYQYLYQFGDALDAFLRFQQFGERQEKEKLQCDMHIAMARNGKKLIERQASINVYKTETVDKNELFGYYNRQLKSGKFQDKSEKTSLFGDSKARTTWHFVPSFLDKGQEVYESYVGTFKKNRDIVVIKKLEGNNWSRPENLGAIINSSFDEDYAYFNMAESALYFSSKGHNSMGGYDIFKSVYNPNTKTWFEPVNLGFPINSPYDDFLFVPADDQSTAWFASNRETKGDKFIVYSIGFSKEYTFTSISANFDFISLSHLSASSSQSVKTKPQTISPSKPIFRPKTVSNKTPEPVIKQTTGGSYSNELTEQKDYNEILNSALQLQLQCDSLSRVAEVSRQNMEFSKNEAERNKLKREIYLLEQRSKTSQQKADEFYEKARAYEIAYSGKSRIRDDSPKITNDMAKNAFKDREGQPIPNSKKTETGKSKKTPKEPVKPAAKPMIYEFKVLAKSPYKSATDIPLNQPLPEGLLYRIQMGAFSKAIEPDRFKGIVPISGETIQNSAITKFYAGMFSKMADAEKALNKVREYGFKDAYIASFFNGKYIPINRAKELEKDN